MCQLGWIWNQLQSTPLGVSWKGDLRRSVSSVSSASVSSTSVSSTSGSSPDVKMDKRSSLVHGCFMLLPMSELLLLLLSLLPVEPNCLGLPMWTEDQRPSRSLPWLQHPIEWDIVLCTEQLPGFQPLLWASSHRLCCQSKKKKIIFYNGCSFDWLCSFYRTLVIHCSTRGRDSIDRKLDCLKFSVNICKWISVSETWELIIRYLFSR